MPLHHYNIKSTWTGNTGSGTINVKGYSRAHTVENAGKQNLELTTDNKHVGEPNKLNPEDLLVTAVASCHMLSYLYVCSLKGVVITSYVDESTGLMKEEDAGGGQFVEVVLKPRMTVADASMVDKAISLHHDAHEICYIANSVNFPIRIEAVCEVG
jgi:organic hydroperoxide reductase OsmC/OhrA